MTSNHRRVLKGVRDPANEVWGEYSRISDTSRDKERGTFASGVGRQGIDANFAAARRGVVITKHYVEDDTSAFKKKRVLRFDPETGKERYVYRVIRPVWQSALQDMRDGNTTGIFVNDLDRMARDPRDLEDAIEVVVHHGGQIVGTGGDIDLMSTNGQFAARLAVSMANKNSADTSRRATRKHLALSTSGGPVGGIRPFGWNEDRLTLHQVESVHLRRWIDMMLQGASWTEIVMDGRSQGVVGTRGRPMVKSSLRQLIFSARNCSFRMFHGELAKDETGAPVVGQWEPICTPDEWLQLTAGRIIPRSHSTGIPKSAKYLLTGIARCGVCKTRMRGARRRVGDKNYDSYICPPAAEGGKQCVARSIREVDKTIVELVLAWGAARRGIGPAATGWARQVELTSAEERLEGYLQDAARGKISDTVLYRMLRIIEEEIKDLQQVKAAWLLSRNRQVLATTAWTPVTWAKLTLNQQREAVSGIILAVEVHPVDGVGRPFDPSKLHVVWRHE